MPRLAFRLLVLCSVPGWIAVAGPGGSAGEPVLYGGIEIGAKGVKVVAVPIDQAGSPDLARMIMSLPHKATNNVTLSDRTSEGEFRTEAIEEARAAVADFYTQLTGDRKIPPERLWVVASSGLLAKGRPKNFDSLRKAVADATGGDEELLEINQEKEVQLLIMGVIPREQLGDTVVLDIGSGNSKLGYFEPKTQFNDGRYRVVSEKIDGTVSLTQSVTKEMNAAGLKGPAAFREVVEKQRREIVDKLANEIGRKAGLINRPRVALTGGLPWAVGMLTDPGRMLDDSLNFEFRLADLREFRRKLVETGRVPVPDVSALPEAIRGHARGEVGRARDQYTPENFLAGTGLILGFAEALQWDEQKTDVNFVKFGVIAWIVAFVEQAKANR